MTIEATDTPTFLPLEDTWDGDTYVLRALVPGVEPRHDIDVTVEGGVLTVHAQRKEEKHETAEGRSFHEFSYGSFTRQVQLPQDTETKDIEATYADGVLEVRVPTRGGGTVSKARRIKVRAKTPRRHKDS